MRSKASAASTAARQVRSLSAAVQVCSTGPKPASFPPMVIVTMSVVGFRAEIWLARTSAVLAPEQATNSKLAG